MKKGLILTSVLLLGIAGLGTACNQAADDHTKMNHGEMNSNSMNHNSMPANAGTEDHGNMNHSGMKSDPNAAAAPYDLQFIDTMISHHQGAIDMAKMIDGKTGNPELKKFGAQIVADQEKEIAQMKDWREKWFKDKPRAVNMEMAGMADSMKMDMAGLSGLKDMNFDIAFVKMMTLHHAGAVEMAGEALKKSERPEIRMLANNIIKAQEAEIGMMNSWKEKWSKQ